MIYRDHHQSLKNEIVGQVNSKNAKFVLAKLQWSKDDVGFSLHVAPHTFTTAGIQTTDFLNYLGFQRSGTVCSFITSKECYVRFANAGFDVNNFANLFDEAFANLIGAQNDLERCGFFFEQPEGWGYHSGTQTKGRQWDVSMAGDGHTAKSVKIMKQSEDEVFNFKFTWIESVHDKGWVIHYSPKHPPLSSEIKSVFQFLGLQSFSQCPEYNFEPCHWKSIRFVSQGNDFFNDNANIAHGWFDAHANYFSSGIQKLLIANAEMEKAGFNFLSFPTPQKRLEEDIKKKTIRPKPSVSKPDSSCFDVALSFAGTERPHAEKLASLLKDAGFSVFYDEFYPEYLWGKNLVDTFDKIFRKQARYCVIFVSKDYKERMWTNHERKSAQARALTEKGKEFILPIKVDDTELDGIPPTLGYVPLEKGIDKIAELLIKKLG